MVKNIRLPKHSAVDAEKSLIKAVEKARYQGHETIQLGNGQLVDAARLEKYLRRRFYPSYTKRTPVRTVHIKPPDTLHVSESVVVFIRSFLRGKWEGTIRNATDLDSFREKEIPMFLAFTHFCSEIEESLEDNSIPAALKNMQKAPAELTKLFRTLPTSALSMFCRFLMSITTMARVGRSEAEAKHIFNALRALLRFTMTYATSPQGLALAASHPLVGIMQGFLAVDDDEIKPLALKGWIMSASTFDGLMDSPCCVGSLADWLNMSGTAMTLGELPSNFGQVAKDTVTKYEEMHGPTSELTIKAMWFHTSCTYIPLLVP